MDEVYSKQNASEGFFVDLAQSRTTQGNQHDGWHLSWQKLSLITMDLKIGKHSFK